MRDYINLILVVITSVTLVHWGCTAAAGKSNQQQQPAIGENTSLPHLAAEMRDTILNAVHSGQITDLKTALELNEMKPDIADEPVDDIITYWRDQSTDQSGKEILDVLSKILELKPAVVPLGRDIENNAIYVWPYLAELDLNTLTPAQDAELIALVGTEQATKMKSAKRWSWYRLTIGADGTWHAFRREK
jgi:hypothetical protein